ncbi:MAG: GyrI-like domain-containing protein [Planctomycetales bacterium]|nr:GyrI-like domain-containing protein [bacterium]UNM08576.1 MAG: GyrI-like domain-containing protein [Planctomycetales bacterium]
MDTVALKPRIVTMGEWTAVGLALDCPNYDCQGISELWQRLNAFLGRTDAPRDRYGISIPMPGGKGIHYWTAVRLMPGDAIPAGLDSIAIPSKRYAVWHFHDDPHRLPRAMGDIFSRRLLDAGLHHDPHWVALEHYPAGFLDEQGGKLHCDLMVAIA